jgi:hypothetical protein
VFLKPDGGPDLARSCPAPSRGRLSKRTPGRWPRSSSLDRQPHPWLSGCHAIRPPYPAPAHPPDHGTRACFPGVPGLCSLLQSLRIRPARPGAPSAAPPRRPALGVSLHELWPVAGNPAHGRLRASRALCYQYSVSLPPSRRALRRRILSAGNVARTPAEAESSSQRTRTPTLCRPGFMRNRVAKRPS